MTRVAFSILLVACTKENSEDPLGFTVAPTGQSACYDNEVQITCPEPGAAFYGQDAQYAALELSFDASGDGTVVDENTGLVWQQTPDDEDRSFEDAYTYCDGLTVGGERDWRLPTLKELFSIGDFAIGWPYLSDDFDIAGGLVSKDQQYWADAPYVGETVEGRNDAAFGVNHGTGHIKAYPASGDGPVAGKYVRCVRGGVYGENDLVDSGDGTITDRATGLQWAQADSAQVMDWESALAYAEGLELAGHDDWRLPNVKELQSIVDYSRSPSATDAENVGPAIDPLFDCTPIVNEAGADDYGYYWSSTSALFEAGGDYYYGWYVAFGRAVDVDGEDSHGAGAVRFDTKVEGGPAGEGGERYYNFVRVVRNSEDG